MAGEWFTYGSARKATVMPDVLGEHSLTQAIVETITEPLLVLDGALDVIGANPAFYRHFGVKTTETLGQPVYALGNGQWNIPALRQLLEEVLIRNHKICGFRVKHGFQSIGERVMLLGSCS